MSDARHALSAAQEAPAGAITVSLKLWEGVRPGTVAKCYGQGHWAYGRVAAMDYAKALPRGGSNNDILVDDYDRLSGATASSRAGASAAGSTGQSRNRWCASSP